MPLRSDSLRRVDSPFTMRTPSSTFSLGFADEIVTSTQSSVSSTWHTNTASDWMFTTGAFRAAVVNSNIGYVLTDNIGGTNLVTNASGSIIQIESYYPYGGLRIDTTIGGYQSQQRKFIGDFNDSLSNLDYFNARYYSSDRGQFISQDPVFNGNPSSQNLADPQSLNAYSYSEDNPIVKKDPSLAIELSKIGD